VIPGWEGGSFRVVNKARNDVTPGRPVRNRHAPIKAKLAESLKIKYPMPPSPSTKHIKSLITRTQAGEFLHTVLPLAMRESRIAVFSP
jgi:hypothetical protein